MRFAGRSAFSLYVMHLPILIMIQMAMEHTALGPLALTVVTGTLTLAICYAIHAAYETASGKIKAYLVGFPLGRRMILGDVDSRRHRPRVAKVSPLQRYPLLHLEADDDPKRRLSGRNGGG